MSGKIFSLLIERAMIVGPLLALPRVASYLSGIPSASSGFLHLVKELEVIVHLGLWTQESNWRCL